MTTCSACGEELHIGDYPFCPHGSIYPQNSQHFDPIVVWQSASDPDKYSFPGQSNEVVPAGYNKFVISNLREADRFVKRMNDLERQRLEGERSMRYAIDDAGVRERRRNEDARGAVNPRAEALRRRVREWADRKREAVRSRSSRIDPQFHINVLSFNSGNRNSYSGPENGWRERKP